MKHSNVSEVDVVTGLSFHPIRLRCSNATTAVWVLAIFHTVAGCCSSAVAQSVNGGEVQANDLLSAIWRHGEKTKSFVFEWKDTPNSAVSENVTARAMRLSDEAVRLNDPGQREVALLNARVMIQDQQPGSYRLVVDGARMRFEESGFEASMTYPLTPVPQEIIRTFDGKVGKSLVAKSAGKYPRGKVVKKNETHALDFVGSLPIVLAVRGAEWADRLGPVRTTVVDGVLNNETIVIFTLSPADGKRLTFTLWCDPARDYQVRRFESRGPNSLRSRHDISYARDEKSGLWIPIRWTRVYSRPDGTIMLQKTSEVTHYSLGREIPSKEFDLTFPPGTRMN